MSEASSQENLKDIIDQWKNKAKKNSQYDRIKRFIFAPNLKPTDYKPTDFFPQIPESFLASESEERTSENYLKDLKSRKSLSKRKLAYQTETTINSNNTDDTTAASSSIKQNSPLKPFNSTLANPSPLKQKSNLTPASTKEANKVDANNDQELLRRQSVLHESNRNLAPQLTPILSTSRTTTNLNIRKNLLKRASSIKFLDLLNNEEDGLHDDQPDKEPKEEIQLEEEQEEEEDEDDFDENLPIEKSAKFKEIRNKMSSTVANLESPTVTNKTPGKQAFNNSIRRKSNNLSLMTKTVDKMNDNDDILVGSADFFDHQADKNAVILDPSPKKRDEQRDEDFVPPSPPLPKSSIQITKRTPVKPPEMPQDASPVLPIKTTSSVLKDFEVDFAPSQKKELRSSLKTNKITKLNETHDQAEMMLIQSSNFLRKSLSINKTVNSTINSTNGNLTNNQSSALFKPSGKALPLAPLFSDKSSSQGSKGTKSKNGSRHRVTVISTDDESTTSAYEDEAKVKQKHKSKTKSKTEKLSKSKATSVSNKSKNDSKSKNSVILERDSEPEKGAVKEKSSIFLGNESKSKNSKILENYFELEKDSKTSKKNESKSNSLIFESESEPDQDVEKEISSKSKSSKISESAIVQEKSSIFSEKLKISQNDSVSEHDISKAKGSSLLKIKSKKSHKNDQKSKNSKSAEIDSDSEKACKPKKSKKSKTKKSIKDNTEPDPPIDFAGPIIEPELESIPASPPKQQPAEKSILINKKITSFFNRDASRPACNHDASTNTTQIPDNPKPKRAPLKDKQNVGNQAKSKEVRPRAKRINIETQLQLQSQVVKPIQQPAHEAHSGDDDLPIALRRSKRPKIDKNSIPIYEYDTIKDYEGKRLVVKKLVGTRDKVNYQQPEKKRIIKKPIEAKAKLPGSDDDLFSSEKSSPQKKILISKKGRPKNQTQNQNREEEKENELQLDLNNNDNISNSNNIEVDFNPEPINNENRIELNTNRPNESLSLTIQTSDYFENSRVNKSQENVYLNDENGKSDPQPANFYCYLKNFEKRAYEACSKGVGLALFSNMDGVMRVEPGNSTQTGKHDCNILYVVQKGACAFSINGAISVHSSSDVIKIPSSFSYKVKNVSKQEHAYLYFKFELSKN